MTSMAFILGVVPLLIAIGAGAEMRRSLGTAVFSGMLGVTAFGIFLTPVFFYTVSWLSERPLLTSAAVEWLGSPLLGGLIGGVIGYLLALLHVGRLPWGPVDGAALGATLALVGPALWRRIRAQRGESAAVISHFFIDRPIFASVLSIVIVLAGAVAASTLPVAQYPDVTPPTVVVSASYPGANALTLRDTVGAPIEEQVSGVEGMIYMSSQCTNDGAYTLTVTFAMGTDSDIAQVLVQNRVSLAQPVIPALVQREGINVRKVSPSTLLIVNLFSPNGEYNDLFLSNYATIELRRRARPAARRGRRRLPRPAQLRHPRLAGPRPPGGGRPDARRRGDRHQPAEPGGGRGADRPTARPQGAAVPAHHQHAGPTDDPRAVRQHYPQSRPREPWQRARQPKRSGGTCFGRAQPGQNSSVPAPTGQAASIVRLRDVARIELGSSSTTRPAPWTVSPRWP